MLRKELVTILAVGMLLSIGPVQSYAIWDIYSDTDIHDGNYGLINIYDTPPDHTTVNMYGGLADYIGTHDYSTLNMYGGQAQVNAFDYSLIDISGGILSGAEASGNGTLYFSGSASSTSLGASASGKAYLFGGIVDHIGVSNFGVVSLHGGTVTDFIGAHDSSTVNIFGYSLTKTNSGGGYGNGQVFGFWVDGSQFSIDLYGSETYSNIILHEIPEPSTFVLFGLGLIFLRQKKNNIVITASRKPEK